jgi:ribosomal protein S28E/S33
VLVPDNLVQVITILEWVMWIEPVRVLKDDGLSGNIVQIRIQLSHGLEKILSVHLNVLLEGRKERELREEVLRVDRGP